MRVLGNTIAQNKQKRNGKRLSQPALASFFTRLRAAFDVGPQRRLTLGLQNRSERHERGLAAQGFTIVELLIVIVVIAILAAITIVSYNGISSKATESALKSDLNTAAKQINIAKVENGSYPSNTNDIKTSGDAEYTYAATDSTFCLSAAKGGFSFKITEAGSIEEGNCGTSTPPLATTMQTFTPAMCASLTTYTGANEEAVIELTDSRGGAVRTYQIAKLADDNCWMLNNLRLGSTTSATTLTPSDSDVASNFTLPQLNDGTRTRDTSTNPGNDYDTPYAYGPVPGDTSSGATNYGYLYNFSAATAGESRTTLPATGGDAQHSICAKGWKLPTGGAAAGASDFSRLDRAFGGNGLTQIGQISTPPAHLATGWLNTGAFKGVFAGSWNDSFSIQGSGGYLWSRSVYPSSSNAYYAFDAVFYSNNVYPGTEYDTRSHGFAVRCLLN